MNQIMSEAREFIRSEEGGAAIEYGLLAALIAVEVISGNGLVGEGLKNTFEWVAHRLH